MEKCFADASKTAKLFFSEAFMIYGSYYQYSDHTDKYCVHVNKYCDVKILQNTIVRRH